jgi:hypothetical protein
MVITLRLHQGGVLASICGERSIVLAPSSRAVQPMPCSGSASARGIGYRLGSMILVLTRIGPIWEWLSFIVVRLCISVHLRLYTAPHSPSPTLDYAQPQAQLPCPNT